MFEKDYYQILGVSENASEEEIKKAFRKYAKELHPDKTHGNKEKEERFKKISEAYDILSDPEKRAKYDQIRKYGFDPSAAGAGDFDFGGADFESILETMFGGGFDSLGGRGKRAARGENEGDIHVKIDVPFETSLRGGKKSVAIEHGVKCGTCDGSGAEKGSRRETCPGCHGTGKVSQNQGFFALNRPCPQCFGSGTILRHPCKTCHGNGSTFRRQTIDIDVPQGIASGKKMRLAGLGNYDPRTGRSGNLIVTVNLLAHPKFERKGDNIHSAIRIPVEVAILGGERTVETVDGPATLRIPPGIQPGGKLRMAEMGFPHGSSRGDHIVTIEIEIPKKLSEEERKLFERYKELKGKS
ncbi:MAG: J domain-containing protein [Planctomycetes bacterium]|nr:J domain-containing protein [Planctomycetota bacterium]